VDLPLLKELRKKRGREEGVWLYHQLKQLGRRKNSVLLKTGGDFGNFTQKS